MRVGWNFVLIVMWLGVGSVAEMGNRTASVLIYVVPSQPLLAHVVCILKSEC